MFRLKIKFLFIFGPILFANAQIKIGNNPLVLESNANFQIEGNATTDQFVVLNNGNVGVSTINPSNKLEVNGNIKTNSLILNWNISNSFAIDCIVKKDDSIYIANANIPANTTFVEGVSGMTWRVIKSGSVYENFIDLRVGLDAIYGKGNWTQRTGIGTGSDIAPALEFIFDLLNNRGGVHIPVGMWLMNSPTNPNKLSGKKIRGMGSQASVIVYNNFSGAMFNFSGSNGYTGGGISEIGIILESGLGNSNAIAIKMEGNAIFQPDQTSFNDLYITALGNSYWYSGLSFDGSARTTPQGIRVSDISNVQVFRCHHVGI